jgi:NAD(P)-dependent dehydrogenase (short-subunit alcohol dehydrogenase family)/pimeloyl-ACP methyl ester carboxylesterase
MVSLGVAIWAPRRGEEGVMDSTGPATSQQVRSSRLDAGDVKLALFQRGDPAHPTLVMVHGYPDTHAVWDELAELLADRFHVVSYDVRGAGASTAPGSTAGYAFPRLICDLETVIKEVSPDEPVHLVGHDWGSLQCWEAVSTPRLAGRVASFTSMSGPSVDQATAWLRHRALRSPHGVTDLASQLARSWYIGFFQIPALPEAVWRGGLGRRWGRMLAASGIEPRPGHPADTVTQDGINGISLYRANMMQRMSRPAPAKVDVPVQVVVATRDRFIGEQTQLSAKGYAPRLWLRKARAPHWIPRTHAPQLAAWITEFTAHVDGEPATRELRRADASRGRQPFSGNLVVVTGAGSGIGRTVCLAFAANGAEVVAADLNADSAQQTCELIQGKGGVAHPYQVDVTSPEGMERFAGWVRDTHGVPDVVVNNAGIAIAGSFLKHTEEDWRRITDVNLLGVVRGCRLFGAQMVERGQGGHLVNIASAAAFAPTAMLPAYSATKAAVRMLSDCLGAELASAGIGVSAICPGFTNTGIARATHYAGTGGETEERLRSGAAKAFQRRNFPPEKVAVAVLRAVLENRSVVPVNAEARVGYALSRLSPGTLRRLARRSDERSMGRLERLGSR